MKNRILVVIACILLSTVQAYGTIWTYTGEGSITDASGVLHKVSTTFSVSDIARDFAGYDPNSGSQGIALDLSTAQNLQLYYNVLQFELEIAGVQSLSGSGIVFGSIASFIEPGYIFTDEWQLGVESGGQTRGLFMDATFPHYDTDGSQWDFRSPSSSQYGQFGPMIDMGPAIWSSEADLLGSQFNTFNPLDLVVKRGSTGAAEVPVPEPATWALISVGLLIIGWKKYRKKSSE